MSEFNKLLESGLLDEETKNALQEALDAKVKERVNAEKEKLREEFARRYAHDKKVMVEAADQMFNETLEKELKEFQEERQQFLEAKVNYKKMMREHAKAVQKFATSKLHEEIKELRQDRTQLREAMQKFENFAVKQLTRELSEFHEDKRDLVETKVKLIKEAKAKVNETRKDFVRRASIVTEGFVQEQLRKEIGQFRKDIKEARKNNFGRRLFEAFAAEFMTSHASDGTQMKKLVQAVKERESKLNEATQLMKKQQKLIESQQHKTKLAESKLQRHKKLNELLSPLPRDKRELMAELLENVETKKLDEAYKKHARYVLNEDTSGRKPLNEGQKRSARRDVTGNRKVNESVESNVNDEEIERLKLLAGVGK